MAEMFTLIFPFWMIYIKVMISDEGMGIPKTM